MEQPMKIGEIATYFKMSKNKIYLLAQNKAITAVKISRQWRFAKNTLNSWVIQQSNIKKLNS